MGMSVRALLAKNATWSLLGTAINTLTGFVVAPYLIHSLGETSYGLWIVMGSVAGYFGLVDLGVRGSVGRFVALYRALGDTAGVNRVFSTSVVLLAGAGSLAFAGMLAFRLIFDTIFDYPAEQAVDVHVTLVLVGITLGLILVGSVFDAVLWGCQRFDLINLVDIPAALARLALTIWSVALAPRLATVALVTLGVSVAAVLAKGILSYREEPSLRVRLLSCTSATIRELFGYGFWAFVSSSALTAKNQLPPLLIGALLGVAIITPFSIANRLAASMTMLLVAGTGILTPYATSLHAQGNRSQEKRLFLVGGRLCLLATLFMTGGLVFLGEPFIQLWIGYAMEPAGELLVILSLGQVLAHSQYVTGNIILAKGNLGLMAALCVAELILTGALLLWWTPAYGLGGACWAIILPNWLCQGVGRVCLGAAILEVPVGRYLTHCLLVPTLWSLPAWLLLGGVTAWRPPVGWLEFFLYATAYLAMFLLGGASLFDLRPLVAAVRCKKVKRITLSAFKT